MANQTSSVSQPLSLVNVRHGDRPVQDEWGIFDPQQAGLEALFKKVKSSQDHETKAPKK